MKKTVLVLLMVLCMGAVSSFIKEKKEIKSEFDKYKFGDVRVGIADVDGDKVLDYILYYSPEYSWDRTLTDFMLLSGISVSKVSKSTKWKSDDVVIFYDGRTVGTFMTLMSASTLECRECDKKKAEERVKCFLDIWKECKKNCDFKKISDFIINGVVK